jgi:hypothetical protein
VVRITINPYVFLVVNNPGLTHVTTIMMTKKRQHIALVAYKGILLFLYTCDTLGDVYTLIESFHSNANG